MCRARPKAPSRCAERQKTYSKEWCTFKQALRTLRDVSRAPDGAKPVRGVLMGFQGLSSRRWNYLPLQEALRTLPDVPRAPHGAEPVRGNIE